MLEKIDRYEILEEIGQGGFATVYRGRDTQLGRQVALKELKPVLLQDETWVDSFKKEARTIAGLDHPHIVTIHDLCQVDNRLFIIMRLVNGESLDKTISTRGPLAWAEVLEIMEAVANGLDYAHAHGILHRDLKPANIFMDSERGPLLGDFGLAKVLNETGESATGTVVGTPNYIAPEVWEGKKNTPQADFYALGCVLYEMLTAKRLFEGLTPPAVMMAHFQPLSLPNQWPNGVPSNVSDILATALAAHPSDRYATAKQMVQALNELENFKSAAQSVAPPQSKKPARPSKPLLVTKFYAPPPRSNLVLRNRLTDQLKEGLNFGCKLTLISAPAGFGKTTVVTEWLSEKSSPQPPSSLVINPNNILWLSLDEEDNDPARFITYLVAALQKLDSSIGEGILQSPQLPPPESLVTVLINDLTPLNQPFALVLDDYHLISTKLVHEIIGLLLEREPPQMHLVITTREDPPLPLSRLRVRGQIVEIRQDELRFTTQEATNFLNQSMGLSLSIEAVAALEARTEGWVAGLQLAALSLKGRDSTHVADFIQAFSGSHRYVIDYLVEEVIRQQPDNIRQFLQQTAILDRLSPALCNAITGRDDSKQILEALEHANLFLIPLDDQRNWSRYHHLFAEFLRTEMAIEQKTLLHQKAAQWFEANNLYREAIKHALAAQDVNLTTRLIIKTGDDALRSNKLITLQGWLNALPQDVVCANPELSIYKGWTAWLLGDAEMAANFADCAENNLPDNAPASIRGKLVSLKACVAISQDITGIETATEALPLLEETDVFYTAMTLMVLGEAQNYLGDTAGAIETLHYALKMGRKNNDPLMIVGTLVNLAQQYNWQGKRSKAVALCKQALEYSFDTHGHPLSVAGFANFGMAEMVLHTGNLDEANAYLQKAQELDKKQAMIGFSIAGKIVLAPYLSARGNHQEALEQVAEAHRLVSRGWFDSYAGALAAYEADYQLRSGDVPAVERWTKTVTLPEKNEKLSMIREMEILTYARLLLAKDQPEDAGPLLEALENSTRANNHQLILLMARIQQVLMYQALQQPEQAQLMLAEAVKMAEPEEYRFVLLWEGPQIMQLLPKVRHVAPAFVDSIFAVSSQWNVAQQSDSGALLAPAQPLIEPLSERELEVLQLIADGYSNKEAAETLVVTVGTVKKHLSNIFGKLGVNSRTQAVARARALGLME